MVGLVDLITDVMQKVVGRQSSKSMLANHGKSVLQLMLCTHVPPTLLHFEVYKLSSKRLKKCCLRNINTRGRVL